MLVDTIAKMTKVIPTIVDDDLSKFETYLADSREWLKREITGPDLYAILEDEGNDDLLAYAETIVAYKAYFEAIPFIDLIGTNAGFAVVRTDTKAPASKERVDALRQATARWLGESIENLLGYLEDHNDLHDEWKGSPAYSLLSDTFILMLRDFRRYAPYEGSRMEWIKLHPEMMNAIKLRIEPRISPELSDQILEQLRDGDITPANSAILENIRFAFTNFTIGNNELAESYIIRVRKVLMKTPTDYPAFAYSDLYASILANAITKNSAENSIFRAGF